MAGLVTKETNRNVDSYIENIGNKSKQQDAYTLLKLIAEISGLQPKVWGNEKAPDFLIGFGNYNYTRKNSKEIFNWFLIGFAPRKTKITLYLTADISKHEELLKQLGKCKWGAGCLYINKLADINLEVLKNLIAATLN